ncbi:MAG: hypothetical protein U0Q15_12815 [Kineosporiaceae bacterium]
MTSDSADGTADPARRDNDGEHPQLDVDAAFAEIVAAWSTSAEDPTSPSSSTPAPARADEDDDAEPLVLKPIWATPSEEEVSEQIDRLVEADAFVPPDPDPLPPGDMVSRLSWLGVLAGPLFLVFAALFWNGLPQWLLLLAVVAFVGGFATLVARMPQERDEDDDDGAVV